MKLDRINIKNFRSIENITIELNPPCRVLVGINESGKTNILKALAMIDKKNSSTNEDVREPLPSEKLIDEAYIRFVFKLNSNEVDQFYKNINAKILSKNKNQPIIFIHNRKNNLKKFCIEKNEGLFTVDVLKQSKSSTFWALENNCKIIGNWKKPKDNIVDPNIDLGNGEKTLITKFLIINHDDYPNVKAEDLEEISPEYLNEIIGKEIASFVEVNLPKVIFWEYDENNLLPPTVNLDNFAANPDSCVPLKNMFILAGEEDIQRAVSNAKSKSINGIRNLLNRIAKHTTVHFRNVWREYKNIEFALEPNSTNIDIFVREKNLWRFSQRSDGFKRFITFLLLISVTVKSKKLKNSLLLIDEPDISLHPSGIKYLRDELIKISHNDNIVVYSTHSIFMIDGDNINRHIIVKKNNEKTDIKDADDSNISEEEVLYNALGYSVFETLNKKNIIFEGWRDKKLFKTALQTLPSKYKFLKNKFKNVGFCYAEGVKTIRSFTPILELAKRDCLIVSDNDEPAKEKQKEYGLLKCYGVWKRYDEINSKIKEITGEDFLKEEVIKRVLIEIKKENPNLIGDPDFSNDKGRMKAFKEWLKSSKIEGDNFKNIIDNIKEKAFANIKHSDIVEDYYIFLEGLSNLVCKN